MADPKEFPNEKDVYPQLLSVAAETFAVSIEEISRNAQAGMLEQWDSFGHLTLFMAIEEKLNVKFLTEEIIALTSLEQIAHAIREKKDKSV